MSVCSKKRRSLRCTSMGGDDCHRCLGFILCSLLRYFIQPRQHAKLYIRFVWPRVGRPPRGFVFLIGWAHALAEGSRLISLLCAAINSPSWRWQWLGSLLVMLLCNLMFRHGYHVSICLCILPDSVRNFLRPGCCSMIHRHARLACGYYRFLSVVSYVLWRILWLRDPPCSTRTRWSC